MGDKIILSVGGTELTFLRTDVEFEAGIFSDVFAKKNNKTVFETLSSKKFAKFAAPIAKYYLKSVDLPLGDFLLERKTNYDVFYKEFLNPYGDLQYCRFKISNKAVWGQKGLYLFSINGKIKYIGRCLDNYKKRINNGWWI